MTEPFRAEQRVLYGDTDSMGVAYYANYLKWFEIGRTELFRRVGSSYRSLEESGCFLPVYEAYCRYHNPARYDDVILIETSFTLAGKARLRFDYRLFDKHSKTLLAEGYTVHVCTDRDGRVLKPPAELRELLSQMGEI
ncbi:MAG: acyl-CoA thioesterase [Deltaproteobacteria bacterium]|jgi:acyl-CoA thioester hydrolase|nr:MAG: acyl-CoA thioesterase [Deltaproteobacteria bacterium]